MARVIRTDYRGCSSDCRIKFLFNIITPALLQNNYDSENVCSEYNKTFTGYLPRENSSVAFLPHTVDNGRITYFDCFEVSALKI